MKVFRFVIRRTTYEMIDILAENQAFAAVTLHKGGGRLEFRTDDKIEIQGIKELVAGKVDHDDSCLYPRNCNCGVEP